MIAVLFLVFGKKTNISYSTGKATSDYEDVLISNKDELDKYVAKTGLSENLETNNYKKVTLSEKYNEEFFQDHKLAIITVYEDDSKEYIHAIEGVEYNSGKTEATINYTYKSGSYLGTLGTTWFAVMLVELEPSVENVNCVNVGK